MKFHLAINMERIDDSIGMEAVARHTLEMVQMAKILKTPNFHQTGRSSSFSFFARPGRSTKKTAAASFLPTPCATS